MQKKLTTAGGNDASAISYFGGGIKTATLSLPGRYIHSPVTVISKDDYNAVFEAYQKTAVMDEDALQQYTILVTAAVRGLLLNRLFWYRFSN